MQNRYTYKSIFTQAATLAVLGACALFFVSTAMAALPVSNKQPVLKAITVHNPNWAEQQLKKAALTHVNQNLARYLNQNSNASINIQVGNIQLPKALTDSHSKNNLTIVDVISSLSDTYSERTLLRAKVKTAEGANYEVGIPVQISIQKPVWVAKQTINAGQSLNPSQFTLQNKDVSHQLPYTVGQDAELSKSVARVNILGGEWLDNRKMIEPADVKINQDIRIIVSTASGIQITVPGTALAEGRIGQTIKVKQDNFGKARYYSAKVMNKNIVLVEI